MDPVLAPVWHIPVKHLMLWYYNAYRFFNQYRFAFHVNDSGPLTLIEKHKVELTCLYIMQRQERKCSDVLSPLLIRRNRPMLAFTIVISFSSMFYSVTFTVFLLK